MTAPALPTAVVNSTPHGTAAEPPVQIILSFDVEEHDRIESAAGLEVPPALRAEYRARLEPSTGWLLEQLGQHGIQATFFLLGQIAQHNPELIRAIHRAGHEIASHGWDHQRLHRLTPASFREDLRQSKDALEQLIGGPVAGYRAPTFSVGRHTAWAIDVLAEIGFRYDSSIYPVRHDRYGVPDAPRAPFRVRGPEHELLELPPATLKVFGAKLPVGGGGYFRLFPLKLLEYALRQIEHDCRPGVAMLYFHPWEFDPEQPRLPLRRLNRFRTYVGLRRSRPRLEALLAQHAFTRAIDVADSLEKRRSQLPVFALAGRDGP